MSNYPLTNGFAYTLATAYVDVAGSHFLGISNIKWTETMEGVEQIPGASLYPVAETPGMYKATVEFEIMLGEYVRLIQKLGGRNYMLKRFNMAAQVEDPSGNSPIVSIEFPALRITEGGGGLEQKASTVSVKTTVGPGKAISYNGLTALAAGTIGVGTSFGASASIAAQVGASLGFSL